MLRSIDQITGHVLLARDGEIGRCKDFLFDDHKWVIRYMVADTGKWIPRKRVLISPVVLGDPDWDSGRFQVLLTKEQIRAAPELENDEPVTASYERKLHQHYGFAPYWLGDELWGSTTEPRRLLGEPMAAVEETVRATSFTLRSARSVEGYSIAASDGDVGRLQDYIVDDESWRIRFLVIDTHPRLPGGKVMIPSAWVRTVHWDNGAIDVSASTEQIKQAPQYSPSEPIHRVFDARSYPVA